GHVAAGQADRAVDVQQDVVAGRGRQGMGRQPQVKCGQPVLVSGDDPVGATTWWVAWASPAALAWSAALARLPAPGPASARRRELRISRRSVNPNRSYRRLADGSSVTRSTAL